MNVLNVFETLAKSDGDRIIFNWEAKIILDLYNHEKETSHHLQNELDKANARICELDKQIDRLVEEQKERENYTHTLEEKLQMFIPRRRVRRVYKMLGKILNADLDPIELEKQLKEQELLEEEQNNENN